MKPGREHHGLSKAESEEVAALIANGNPDDGVAGGPTAWKVVQGVTAIARAKDADRRQELHAIASDWLDKTLGNIEQEFERENEMVTAN